MTSAAASLLAKFEAAAISAKEAQAALHKRWRRRLRAPSASAVSPMASSICCAR
jgi:hypothetical protein